MIVLKVLVEHAAYALNRPFSYVYNEKEQPCVGARVVVPFNNKDIVGYIESIEVINKAKEEYEEELGFNLNFAKNVIDKEAILTKELRDLASEVANYYHAPLISVYQAMLPPSLKPTSSSFNNAKIQYEKYVKCVNSNEDGLTSKQVELLRLLNISDEVKKSEIKSLSVLKKLIENGNVIEIKKEKMRYRFDNIKNLKEYPLTTLQEQVKNEFLNSNDLVYLLEGVTGSGKTEVYIKLVKETIASGKNALILVPEISLTPVMLNRFYTLFEKNVAILHSELTSGEI